MRLTFFFFLMPIILFGQKFKNADNNIHRFLYSAYLYKIYVHTDKEKYFAGEDIWFKAYLFSYNKKSADVRKQITIVQLINFEKKIVIQKNYFFENGTADGKIHLPDTLWQGVYQLRIFTYPQRNFSSKFYFTKNIYISSNKIAYGQYFYKEAKKIKRQNKKIFLKYTFDAHKCVENLPCRIYFFSYDNKRKPLNADIYLVDNKGNTICNKTNINNGYFNFTPKKDTKYFLIAKIPKYRKAKIPINNISEQGIVCSTSKNQNGYNLTFFSNKIQSNDTVSSTYLLCGYNEGKIVFFDYFKIDSLKKLFISKEHLCSGINFFFLINKYSEIECNFTILKNYTENDLLLNYSFYQDTLTFSLTSNSSIEKNISISITNDTQQFCNINQYINFYSNLPDYENKTISYQLPQEILSVFYAQLPFDFQKTINTNKNEFTFLPQKSLTIKGHVSFLLEKAPAQYAKVKLKILNSFNDELTTVCNKFGYFEFSGLLYKDSIEFLLEGVNRNNKKYVIFYLQGDDSEKIFFNPLMFSNLDNIRLKHVKHPPEPSHKQLPGTLHSQADQIIYSDEIEQSGQMNLLEFLQGRVPGYQRLGNSSVIRGFSSITQSNEPLYMIDNIQVDASAVSNMNPHNVDRIEILKSSSNTAIYGQRGSNGVIAVYTKQGYNIDWGKLHGKMAGISYSEKFAPSNNNSNHKTFYWNPNINFRDKITVKIPLLKKGKYFVYINGVDEKNQPISLAQEIDILH